MHISKQPALSAAHCTVLQQPFYQFAQMKQYAPDSIESVKTQYRAAWRDWCAFVTQVQAALAAQNVPIGQVHIERWCNGWQVRAHFFAFVKLTGHEHDAPILSLILNRERLTVSLDWHAYKAAQSGSDLAQYHGWLSALHDDKWTNWRIWRGKDSEYATHECVGNWQTTSCLEKNDEDFWRIGQHLPRECLDNEDSVTWATKQLLALLPLYAMCFES